MIITQCESQYQKFAVKEPGGALPSVAAEAQPPTDCPKSCAPDNQGLTLSPPSLSPSQDGRGILSPAQQQHPSLPLRELVLVPESPSVTIGGVGGLPSRGSPGRPWPGRSPPWRALLSHYKKFARPLLSTLHSPPARGRESGERALTFDAANKEEEAELLPPPPQSVHPRARGVSALWRSSFGFYAQSCGMFLVNFESSKWTYDVYRGQVIYWVKGSEHILF